MATLSLAAILADLQAQNPTLTEVVNGEVVPLSEERRQEVLLSWAQAAFAAQNAPKSWPDVQAFSDEFTLAELGQIELSQDPSVAELRGKLHTWRSGIVASHGLVQAGRQVLLAAGILTPERADAIFGPLPS